MKLREVLSESITPIVNVSKYLEIARKADYRRIKQLEEAFSKMEAAFRAGECVNTSFNGIKSNLNKFVELTFEKLANEFLYGCDFLHSSYSFPILIKTFGAQWQL